MKKMNVTKIKIKAIKLAIIGDTPAGKTSIIESFMNMEYKDDKLPTIGSDKLETKFTLKNREEIKVVSWDSAGGGRFQPMTIKSLKTCSRNNFSIWANL